MNLKQILFGFVGAAVIGGVGFQLYGQYVTTDHTGVPLLPPQGVPKVQAAPADWHTARAARNIAKARYVAERQIAFDWFADFPFSQTDGTPLIILKLLPLIAPDKWQGGDKFLSEVGLFFDARSGNDFIPRGIGFSGLDPLARPGTLDLTSLTCGGCHIGRVIGGDGKTIYIDGAVNTTFNINKYYVQTFNTLQTIYDGETDRDKQIDRLTGVVLEALDQAVKQSPTFFYNDFKTPYRNYDAGYEVQQIQIFRAGARGYVKGFANYTEKFFDSFSDYLDKSYVGYKDQMLSGIPGMADATGVSSSHGYGNLKAKVGKDRARFILPDHPGITDYMAVWDQDARAAEWDPTKQQLINGGGQYNGNIPIPMFRNMAASTTMGLDNPDMRVPAFATQLLGALPSTAYPFEVNVAAAKTGETLFAENCAACHQPNNGAVYDKLGTSLARSNVINTALMLSARQMYHGFCPPTLELDLAGIKTKPCAEYLGVSLRDFDTAIMRPLSDQLGYNATALRGIWATAPYLHNGSVPTMRHVLMPDTRPATFVKGLLTYDTENMGFAWKDDDGTGAGMVFDTAAFHAVSNKGHDKDIVDGDKTYKLDWSNDPKGADALVEYLKTL
ncbi:cytochrome C [Rhizobium leguminosarum]|uniref:c-type cytochrome n=1 Tax=Rhizobium leguminosarum TaxID=384 RepID=UPI003F980599